MRSSLEPPQPATSPATASVAGAAGQQGGRRCATGSLRASRRRCPCRRDSGDRVGRRRRGPAEVTVGGASCSVGSLAGDRLRRTRRATDAAAALSARRLLRSDDRLIRDRLRGLRLRACCWTGSGSGVGGAGIGGGSTAARRRRFRPAASVAALGDFLGCGRRFDVLLRLRLPPPRLLRRRPLPAFLQALLLHRRDRSPDATGTSTDGADPSPSLSASPARAKPGKTLARASITTSVRARSRRPGGDARSGVEGDGRQVLRDVCHRAPPRCRAVASSSWGRRRSGSSCRRLRLR